MVVFVFRETPGTAAKSPEYPAKTAQFHLVVATVPSHLE